MYMDLVGAPPLLDGVDRVRVWGTVAGLRAMADDLRRSYPSHPMIQVFEEDGREAVAWAMWPDTWLPLYV